MKNQSRLELRYGARVERALIGGGGTNSSSSSNNAGSRSGSQRPSSAQNSPRGSANNSRSSSITAKPRANTPAVMGGASGGNSFPSANFTSSVSSSYPASAGASPVPLTSKLPGGRSNPRAGGASPAALIADFTRPTAAAERRGQNASVLAERLRNIVSKHEERVTPMTSPTKSTTTAGTTTPVSNIEQQHYQRQMNAALSAPASTPVGEHFYNHNNSNNNSKAAAMRMMDRASRVMIGGDGAGSAPSTPREAMSSAPSSQHSTPSSAAAAATAALHAMARTAVNGAGAAIDVSRPETWNRFAGDSTEMSQLQQPRRLLSSQQQQQQPSSSEQKIVQYNDDDDDDAIRNNNNSSSSHSSPQRTPNGKRMQDALLAGFGQAGGAGSSTIPVPGFSWCQDWTRRGMRPPEVVWDDKVRAAADASSHVEPRNLDMWLAAPKTGSYLCRRCGLPAFPASCTADLPRAGHLCFTQRFSRSTEPELSTETGGVIMRCARCASFLADIYDMQSRNVPPLIRASSWCLWHAPSVVVPKEYATLVGPYVDEDEQEEDDELFEKLGREIRSAEDLF